MKHFQIESLDSVNSFLFKIYDRTETIFDPAEDLRDLKDKNGFPLLPKDEAEYLDDVMMQCFIYCVLNDLDIYVLANKIQSKIFQSKNVA